jgi:nitrite reductase/ring-hydroxylating ferredoxin subunit
VTAPELPTRVGVLVGDDPWVTRRLADLGEEQRLRWVPLETVGEHDDPPGVVVVELSDDDAVAVAGTARARWPGTYVVGYLTAPDQQRWLRAQRGGFDLVVNRGALFTRLRAALAQSGRPSRRYPLLDASDLAGRLGLVGRVEETPVGPVAVYHLDGQVYATQDRCPHAGAVLSEGELDRCVVTCPRHGSQFDVRTGERVRGPADSDLTVHRVEVTEGQVALVLEEEQP